MRIRNFGFLANRKRASLLPLCFQLHPPQLPPAATFKRIYQTRAEHLAEFLVSAKTRVR
jgi:hypothetical protein